MIRFSFVQATVAVRETLPFFLNRKLVLEPGRLRCGFRVKHLQSSTTLIIYKLADERIEEEDR